MKLSILIPIFNFDVTHFVSELHRQSETCGIDFEIVCIDDASEEKFRLVNRAISSMKNVKYSELTVNIGRSAIRNLLAQEAQYDFLLFFDCDSKIISENFIKSYLDNISPYSVLFGGRSYDKNFPKEKDKILRWHYGMQREFIPFEKRKKNPYKYFMTNNFLIPQNIFLSVKMNENLNGYGHEDTLFAQELKKKKIQIRHIDNYLCHIGLEDADEFLSKTKQGISNLAFLIKNNLVDDDVKIFRYYKFSERFYLQNHIQFIGTNFYKLMSENLKSQYPNLLYFDFLKLYWLILEMKK